MHHLKLIPTVITETKEQIPTIEITRHKTRRHLIIIISEITLICSNYLPQILVVAAMQQLVDITGSIKGVD